MGNPKKSTKISNTQKTVQSKIDQLEEIHFSEVNLLDHNLANEIGLNPLKQAMHWNLNLVRITNHSPILINQGNESRSRFIEKTIHPQKQMGQPSNPGRGYTPRFPKRKPVKNNY